MSLRTRRKVRFRVGGLELVDTGEGAVIQLDEAPAEPARTVTVFLAPGVPLDEAAAELELLALALDETSASDRDG